MKVKSIADCSTWSILQYFWPAWSETWSWKPIFGLLESGCFTQVLLYLNTFWLKWSDGMLNSVNPYQTAPSEFTMFDQAFIFDY